VHALVHTDGSKSPAFVPRKVRALTQNREVSMYALYMRHTIPLFLLVMLMSLTMGCAHKYSPEEFNAVVDELNTCTEQLKMTRDENATLKKLMNDTQENLKDASSQLSASVDERQQLLDKNIQCLEEKKALLKQISRFNAIIQERKEAQWRMNKAYEYILAYLETERLNDQAYIIRSQDKIKIVIPQRSIFPNARSAWLTPKGAGLIGKIARGLKQMDPIYVEIGGHTDNTPVSNEMSRVYPTNWHLAQARSMSVLIVLNELGIPKDKMCAISYGETKPIADSKSEEGRSMNRRVELVITP